MRSMVHQSLFVKAMAWLSLHLVILALGFFLFVKWQLGFGLESLLSGSAGDSLRAFGDRARAQMIQSPRSRWNDELRPLAEQKQVIAGIYDFENPANFPTEIPPLIVERAKTALASQAPPRRNPPPGLEMDGHPPDAPHLRSERTRMPPGLRRGDGPAQEDFMPPRRSQGMAEAALVEFGSRPLFLVKGEDGRYWAGVQLSFSGMSGRPPREHLLLIRSETLDAGGMFVDFKPWLWGGLAVLGLSVAFWAPFIWRITHYLNRLSTATERIASGDFKISIPPAGNDELGHLGDALASMALRLNQSVSRQKRFLGDAAHELCAPLARLRTGLGILEMKLAENHAQELESIEADAQELALLVEEILAFSRAGNRTPRSESIILRPFVEGVVAREAGPLMVKIEIPSDLKCVTDPSLIGRAIGNLVRNARTHAGSDAKVTVSATLSAGFVSISVADDGPGVDPEELPRLFEPFYRPDRSRSRDTGGSGLGLAIVRTAVEACGGETSARIPAEGGFAVIIRVPNLPET
jgi:two-component system sensor histidine kinase CpxA